MVTAMENDNKFRVWVGCLACYNEGRLIGDWFDAEDCPQDEDEFNEAVPGHKQIRQLNPHEEFWVMDHENSPVSGEYSPMDAVKYAEWMGDADPDQLKAWLGNGYDFNEDTVEEMDEAYAGQFDSDADFALHMAEELGMLKEDMPWPYSCVDWDHAARELMYDYWSDNGYYFRSL